jgi:4-amino-4-deoxy-L-arabinose transferase-like glycosyltransferase
MKTMGSRVFRNLRLLDFAPLLVILGLSALILADFWNGYMGEWDDDFYIRAILGWMSEPPYVGSTHWELRHPYVLSLVASVSLLGMNETALVLPSIASLYVLLCILYVALLRYVGVAAAVTAVTVLALSPLLNIYATVMRPGLPEAVLVVGSLAIFFAVVLGDLRAAWLTVSGALAAMAFLIRETAGALMLFYFVLYLFGFGIRRSSYVYIALGFVPLWLLEVVYLWLRTGDPVYRYVIDLAQYHPPRPENLLEPNFGDPEGTEWARRILNGEPQPNTPALGAASIVDFGRYLNPIVALFVNHEYALVFFVSPFALLGLVVSADQDQRRRRAALLVAFFGLLWWAVVAYLLVGRPKPNYFMPLFVSATVVIALYVEHLWQTRRRLRAAAVFLLLSTGGLFAMELHQYKPTYAGRVFAQLVQEYREPIYTDSVTRDRARFFVEAAGLGEYVPQGPVKLGALLLVNDAEVDRIDPMLNQVGGRNAVVLEAVERVQRRDRLPGVVLRVTGLDSLVPPHILRKLTHPEEKLVLYRVKPRGNGVLSD